jgi:hypothetical protein
VQLVVGAVDVKAVDACAGTSTAEKSSKVPVRMADGTCAMSNECRAIVGDHRAIDV